MRTKEQHPIEGRCDNEGREGDLFVVEINFPIICVVQKSPTHTLRSGHFEFLTSPNEARMELFTSDFGKHEWFTAVEDLNQTIKRLLNMLEN